MVLRCIVGAALIAVSVVLMVWGQKYLGEEKGRNPRPPSNGNDDECLVSPCSSCGACDACKPEDAEQATDCTNNKS
jgi:hypothetical protein